MLDLFKALNVFFGVSQFLGLSALNVEGTVFDRTISFSKKKFLISLSLWLLFPSLKVYFFYHTIQNSVHSFANFLNFLSHFLGYLIVYGVFLFKNNQFKELLEIFSELGDNSIYWQTFFQKLKLLSLIQLIVNITINFTFLIYKCVSYTINSDLVFDWMEYLKFFEMVLMCFIIFHCAFYYIIFIMFMKCQLEKINYNMNGILYGGNILYYFF